MNSMNGKIGAIIVLYYPDFFKVIKLIDKLLSSVDRLVVLDNTPGTREYENKLKSTNNLKLNYISLGSNKGIAEAQNVGFKSLLSNSEIRFIFLFDQDSIIPSNYVSNMVDEYIRINKYGIKTAAIGPKIVNLLTKREYKTNKTPFKLNFKIQRELISSGKLICADVLRVVGFMDSELFIDYVDFEWCWRATSKGYNSYKTNRVEIYHMVGKREISFFGFPIIISASKRYYYQYRNFILLINKSYVPLKWKFKKGLRLILLAFLTPFVSENKKRVVIEMLKGVKDGFKMILTL